MGSTNQLPGPPESGPAANFGQRSGSSRSHGSISGRSTVRRQKATGSTRRLEPPRIGSGQIRDAVFFVDAQSRLVLDVNASGLRLTGYRRPELLGASLSMLVPAADDGAQRRRIAALARKPSAIMPIRYRHKDGSIVDVEIEERLLAGGRILAVLRSSSRGQRDLGSLNQSLSRFDAFFAVLDAKGRISYVNDSLAALTRRRVDQLVGTQFDDLMRSSLIAWRNQIAPAEGATEGLSHVVSTEVLTSTGERRAVALSKIVLRSSSDVTLGAVIVGQDLSHERAAYAELERKLLEREQLAQAISRLQTGLSTEAAARAVCRELRSLRGVDVSVVMALAADGAVTVLAIDSPNDFPMTAGERLPAARATYLFERAAMGPWVEAWDEREEDGDYGRRLTKAGLRSTSYAPIRYGDKTLGLLVAGSLDPQDAFPLIESLPAISEFGSAASAILALDLKARTLLDQRRVEVAEILDKLAFHPVFQPIVELQTRRQVGYEALTRFDDGIAPDRHFSTAWSVGLGAELELATLGKAIKAARRWLPPETWLNLNISPGLLLRSDELSAVLNPAYRSLVLEVTEHEAISDYPKMRAALKRLRPALVAVDDAGAGIATFAHIVELQPDFIKVDIRLIRDVNKSPARQAMILALAHFAQATECQLIAEGVETSAEDRTLVRLGVGLGQGYLYGRPKRLTVRDGVSSRRQASAAAV